MKVAPDPPTSPASPTSSAAPSSTEWAGGIEARSRALVSDGRAAEGFYRAAIDHLGRTRVRAELLARISSTGSGCGVRAERHDAREQLRLAHEMLTTMGSEAFTERARRELLATGEKVRQRSPETRDQLTPQETQIARLARDGLSNPEIGGQLFLSARTVEWHLRKVFTKLGISSRRQLPAALSDAGRLVASA